MKVTENYVQVLGIIEPIKVWYVATDHCDYYIHRLKGRYHVYDYDPNKKGPLLIEDTIELAQAAISKYESEHIGRTYSYQMLFCANIPVDVALLGEGIYQAVAPILYESNMNIDRLIKGQKSHLYHIT